MYIIIRLDTFEQYIVQKYTKKNNYFIILFFVSCRSSRIAVAYAYCTGLSTVQVSYLNSEKANEDLPE